MALFILTPLMLERAKKRLRPLFPEVKSSHLSEALAAALGYKTHASVLKYAEEFDPEEDELEVVGISKSSFYDRLRTLGASFTEDSGDDLFELPLHPEYPSPLGDHDLRTGPDVAYTKPKAKAWRNLMVASINAGLEQGHFSLRKGDNRWSETDPDKGHIYRFFFACFPALCCVKNAGNGELSFHAVVFPEPDAEQWLFVPQLGLSGGEAYGMAWLEREKEARLETSMGFFKSRQVAQSTLAALEIETKGYAERSSRPVD